MIYINQVFRLSRKIKILIIFLLYFFSYGCMHGDHTAAERESPLYITPVIEGINLCREAIYHDFPFDSSIDAINWCIKNGYTAADLLNEKLEKLEPGGAKGNVQVGYQIAIFLLGLYEKHNEEWIISEPKVKSYLDLIKNVDRPVVIYIVCNHFDSKGALAIELAENPQNLMLLKNGEPPIDDYFGNAIIPFTLLTDESIPVNYYRFKALRHISKKISELPEKAIERIIGITMAGEIHHMFPDFTNGTGEYDNYQVTDYSLSSIRGFQAWLEEKYGTINNLNIAIGSNFLLFSEITPPSKNIHMDKISSFTEHYDAYASGYIPISGWLWDPEAVVDELILYINGVEVGNLQVGFHRLDVYRAIDEITDPDTGFRYDLDYREFKPGNYNAQVIARSNNELFLLGEAEFVVVDREKVMSSATLPDNQVNFSSSKKLKGTRHWLDLPKPQTAVFYNPLAIEWNEYRSRQVANFLDYFWFVSIDSGLPPGLLYSHQIYPKINSSWNPQLFMVEESFGEDVPYQLGICLYGGATHSDIFRQFLEERKTEGYGVPEFHTQQWKKPQVAIEAMYNQYNDGAAFISPFYISLIPESLRKKEENTLRKFEIRPDNKLEGSNLFYEAILEFAKQ